MYVECERGRGVELSRAKSRLRQCRMHRQSRIAVSDMRPTLRSSVSAGAVVYGAHSSRLMRSAFPRRQANSR